MGQFRSPVTVSDPCLPPRGPSLSVSLSPDPAAESTPAADPGTTAVPAAATPRPAGRSGRGLRYDVLVIAILTALTLTYFYPLFLGRTNSILGPYGSYVYPWASVPNGYGLTEPQTDYAELSYPWLVATDRALADNTLPLWSADVYGGGYDLFANGSSALLYPPRLLALAVTSPVRAHDLFLVFHLWGSGIAMYLLVRQLALGRWAGAFAAVAWMFATWNTAWMQLEVVTPMALFLPATVAVVHRAMTRRSLRALIGAGLVCALAASSGHLLLLGTTLLVAASYAAALSVGQILAERRAGSAPGGPRHLRRSWTLELGSAVGRLALLGAVAAGAAAVVLLPTVLALRAGQRVPFTYDELRQQFLAEPFMLKRLFLPPDLPMTADQMQYLGFVGSSTVVFALVGLFSRRRAGAWLARVLVVAVPLIMIGTPLTELTWRFVPGMNVFRPYSRLIVFAAFGLVLAAALGVQMVLDGIARQRPTLQPAIRVGLAMAIVVTAGQLMFLGRRSNPPFVPHEARYALPSTPLIEEVRGNANPNGWPARVIPVFLRRANDSALSGVTLYANTAQAVGLDTMSGYDSSVDRRTLVLLRVLNGADPNDTTLGRYPAAFLAAYESWSTRFTLLARLGVTDVVTVPNPTDTEVVWNGAWTMLEAERVYTGADGIIYRVPDAVAGPRLVGADDVVASEQAALVRFTEDDFPAQDMVVVERGELARTDLQALGPPPAATFSQPPVRPPAGAGTQSEDPAAAGTVVRAQRGVNTVALEVNAEKAAWVVLPDAWAEGWSATVNGADTPVVRVNYYQRAVQVQPGISTIAMRYRPPGFVAGAVLSTLSWALALGSLAALSLRAAWWRRRSARRRLQFEDQLVAKQAGAQRHPDLVDTGDHPPTETGPSRPL